MIIQGIMIAGTSVLIGSVIVLLARRGLLSFRYTMGWISLLTVSAFSSLFVRLYEPLSRVLEVTPGAVVGATGVVILILICIQLSISISGLQKQVRRLAEIAALSSMIQPQEESPKRVLVIVPALNEERNVGIVVQDLVERGYRVLAVDDGSTDRTTEVARAAGAHAVTLPFNTGVGGALRTGLRFAVEHDFPLVVQCDADGQHPIHLIELLINTLESRDCHMVIGSRFVNGRAEAMKVPKHRRFVMWVLGRSATRAVGTRITDVTSGFRAFRGELIPVLAQHMPAYYLGDTFEAVISAGRAGYRIEEVAAPISERLNGKSTAHPLQAARLTAKAFLTSTLHLHVRLPPPTTASSSQVLTICELANN